ncbi:hypothetical protein XCY_001829 [Xanthomonas arboricola pv. juglandis]|uniref:hypothetical protein n=1 Tax=Xanthomonas arboricola TaxID=56448 RepID=UPI001AF8F67E|nr:hypothetical protein [Xanthomonas arboricola]CAG2089069.1 hypothetical protein XCY_001829 [Xanthomonas arboricola pv. juglandis]
MRERPIRLKAHEVRAILSGAKTQTRCVAKPVKHPDLGNVYTPGALVLEGEPQHVIDRACPFGQPGERLWVKETTVRVEEHGYIGPVYAASQEGQDVINWGLAPAPDDCTDVEPYEIKLRPSIHMPRSMCRLVLEITDVRVERLHAISAADAEAEGIDFLRHVPDADETLTPQQLFHCLWDGTGGDWDANPWVWVISFRRLP